MTNSADGKTYALFDSPTNKKTISELEKNRAKVFKFPMLKTEKAILDEKSVAGIKNLSAFDWVIFPDVLTVGYFLEILRENDIDLFEMDSLQVCAFGEAIADCLRFEQLHADVIPSSVDAAKVFLALTDYVGKDEIKDKKFLFPKEISLEYEIEKTLNESGAKVMNLPVYQSKPFASEITKLKVLLKSGGIDEFIFSTPTDIIALKSFFKDEPISKILSETIVSTVDKIVLQTLKEHDLKANYLRLK